MGLVQRNLGFNRFNVCVRGFAVQRLRIVPAMGTFRESQAVRLYGAFRPDVMNGHVSGDLSGLKKNARKKTLGTPQNSPCRVVRFNPAQLSKFLVLFFFF